MQHPAIEGDADDGAAADEAFRLLVGELALVGNERAVVVMAGQDGAAVDLQSFVEALIRKMRDIEDHADACHLLEKWFAGRKKAALGAGAVAVGADAVMGRADDAQAGVEPFLHLVGPQDRVGPFHAEDVAERQGREVLVVFPGFDVSVERGPILDEAQDAFLLQAAIIGKLAICRTIRSGHRTNNAGWPAWRRCGITAPGAWR